MTDVSHEEAGEQPVEKAVEYGLQIGFLTGIWLAVVLFFFGAWAFGGWMSGIHLVMTVGVVSLLVFLAPHVLNRFNEVVR